VRPLSSTRASGGVVAATRKGTRTIEGRKVRPPVFSADVPMNWLRTAGLYETSRAATVRCSRRSLSLCERGMAGQRQLSKHRGMEVTREGSIPDRCQHQVTAMPR
jgi:hypothetical protein